MKHTLPDQHLNASAFDFFNLVSSGIFITDARGTIQTVNQSLLTLLGYEDTELVGKKYSVLFFERQSSANAFLKQKETKGIHVFLKNKSGAKIQAIISFARTESVGKKAEMIIFTVEDFSTVTDLIRKRLEEAMPALQKVALGDFSSNIPLSETEDPFTEHFFALNLMVDDFRDLVEKYRKQKTALEEEKNRLAEAKAKDEATLEGIGDGVMAVNKKGEITLMNSVALEAIGASHDELLGKYVWNVFDIKDNAGATLLANMHPVFNSIQKGEKIIFTNMQGYTFVSKKMTFPLAINVNPIVLDKTTIGAVMIFRDVTQERSIDKAKSEFVSLASHQLRTPLTAINWYTEMLISGDAGKMTDEQNDYLKQVEMSTRRMVDLVDSLLNVSRIDLGTLSVDPEILRVEEIAETALSELRPQIEEKKLVLTKTFSGNIPTIMADPRLVGIIFQNVLSNAIKYTPAQGQIHITLEKDSKNIIFTCADTGYGIPKNQQSKIFSKLFRADNVVSKDVQGTGLGLYLVKAILDQCGGEISFTSEENKGTTFRIGIPLSGMQKKKGAKTLTVIKK